MAQKWKISGNVLDKREKGKQITGLTTNSQKTGKQNDENRTGQNFRGRDPRP